MKKAKLLGREESARVLQKFTAACKTDRVLRPVDEEPGPSSQGATGGI